MLQLFLAAVLGLAFQFTDSIIGLLTAWCFLIGWAYCYELAKVKWYHSLMGGTLCYLIACSWLPEVLGFYFEIPIYYSAPLSLVVAFTVGLQWLLAHWLFNALLVWKRLNSLGLALPLAWFSASILTPKIFPWSIGSTQTIAVELIQLADIGGVYFVDMVLLWIAVFAARGIVAFQQAEAKSATKMLITALGVLALTISYGVIQESRFSSLQNSASKITLGIVQPKFNPKEHFQKENALRDLKQVQQLSKKIVRDNEIDLLVWPESSVTFNYWTHETQIKSGSFRDPLPGVSVPILFGTQVRDSQSKKLPLFYNAALLINSKREIVDRYFKMNLFPFTESSPLNILSRLSDSSTKILPGRKQTSIELPMIATDKNQLLSAAVVICYEDMLSDSLLRIWNERKLETPDFIVALSNDSWFLDSQASSQHDAIASLRSIEFRKTLVRVTANGVSSVTDSTGIRRLALPIQQKAEAAVEVPIITNKSLFSGLGAKLSQALAILIVLVGIYSFCRNVFALTSQKK